MNKRFLLTLSCLFLYVFSFAQEPFHVLPHPVDSTSISADSMGTIEHAPELELRNGNGTLGQIYNQKKCGLNFTQANAKTGKRFSPAGVNQPAPLAISGIPTGAVIEKAYLWASGSGDGTAQTATVVNPASVSTNFPMAVIGSGPDKCWSYSGSYNYRADITSIISGNGTYNVSGILTNPPTSGNDMDGIALVVIYSDPCASYEGELILHDGMVVINGGSTTQNITGISACSNSTAAQAFMYVGDMQMAFTSVSMNGTAATGTWNWWNYFNVNTSVTAGQTTSAFTVNSSGDCFDISIMGLYFQTTGCSTCGPTATGTATNPTDVNLCAAGPSVSFSTTASGATPLGYQWYVDTGSGFTALSDGGAYSGVNTATLTVSPTTAAMNGYQYHCVVDFCGPDVTTGNATLYIASPPVAVCQNISVNLSTTSAIISASSIDGGSTVACGVPVLSASQTFFDCTDIGPNNVTLSVFDGVNTSTCTAVVTVLDVTPPSITCPPNATGLADPGLCSSSTVFLGNAFGFDECDLSLTIANDAPAVFPVGVTNVTWTATDDGGNTATCVQTVTVTDYLAPTISCPSVFPFVYADPGACSISGASVSLGTPTVTDQCAYTLTNNAPLSYPVGTTNVTWTATDVSGNASTCTQPVTVADNQAPTITCPSNVSANTTAGSCVATGLSLGTPVTADNCTVATVTNDAPAGGFPVSTTAVTWTVTDNSGNVNVCTQQVTVVDNQDPTIVCPSNVSVNTDAGSCVATGVSLGTPVTSDNCAVASVTNDAPASFPVGITTVTWTVTDNHGRTATCTQTVTVTDNQNPTITCPLNISVNTDAGSCVATGVSLGTPVTSDNCTVASVTNDAPAGFPVGTTTVTWTVTDGAGNTATCTQTVTVTDNQVPTIVCPSNVSVGTDAGSCIAAAVSLGTPTTSDNCTVASVTNDAPASFPLGTTTVTWTVTDGAGNTNTCTQTVTVSDNQVPIIVCPSNVNVNADAGSCTASGVILGSPVTSDNCTVASVTNNAPAVYPVGTTTVTWTVTDAAGNANTCTQTVTVTDSQNPTITCPGNLSISPDAGSCFATGISLGTPVTSDNCSVAGVTNDAPAAFPGGTTTVTWTVTDASGNTATCTQTVSVTDNENPVITCPTNIAVNTDPGSCSATSVALGTPVTSDNCIVASVTNDAPSGFPLGATTVTWTATDNAGNTATCTQTVTVTDNQNPNIVCPPNVSVNTDAGSCTATGVALGAPTTSDNCTVASVTNDAPASYPIGTTVVTWTVTDGAGNTANCTQTVTVTDNQNPTIVCPAAITTGPDAGSCTATGLTLGTPITSDNCTVASVTNDAPVAFTGGTTVVTWTVTDGAGNTATCTQNVTVTDNQNPVITCPSNVSVSTDVGSCSATSVSLGTPVTSDNCSVSSVTNDAPASFPLGITTVTWTVTDGSGNTATCTQNVTVTDNQNPTIVCPSNVTVSTDPGSCLATGVSIGTPVTTDNCTVSSVTNDSPASFPLGTTTVTWTVTDGSGNTATCTQTVTVTDNQDPTIVCPSDVSVNTDFGSCAATGISLGTPATSDNCTVSSVTNDAPVSFPIGVTTVTWTVTDGAGNTTTCTQTVTVADNENPTITCPSNLSANTDVGLCTATVGLGTPVTADNCTVLGVTSDAPSSFSPGTTTVTWTVSDGAGNTATCAQTVTVTDIQAPVASCQNITVNLTSTGSVTVPWTSVDNGSTDNCGIVSAVLSPATFTCADFGANNVTLTVTDNAGNSSSCTATVTIAGAPLSIAPPVITNVDCYGNTTGDIDLTISGGFGTLTYDWDNDGIGDADDNEDLLNVAAGTYTIIVTDAASCSTTQTYTVTQPAALAVTATATDASCFGYTDGSATATVSGGTGSYQYVWSSGSVTNVASSLAAGTYTVTVTDSAGCISAATATVNEPAQIVPLITGPASVCDGQPVTLTASGGTAYSWSTGGTSASITDTPLAATTYTVTASIGICTGTASYTVTIDPLAVADVSGDSILCTGETSVLTATGGNTYAWSDGTTGAILNIDNTSAGNIYVVAANGCGTDTAFVVVINDIVPAVDAGVDQIIGIGQTATLSPSGGTNYSWSPPGDLSCAVCENPVAMPLQTTTYTVTSQDQYGCTATDEVVITVETTTSVLLPDIFSPDGNGVNDVLLVRGTGIQGMVFRLYDRWGQKVFESLDQSVGWDGTFHGKPLDTGVFVYTLTGTFYTGEKFEKKGNITLKR